MYQLTKQVFNHDEKQNKSVVLLDLHQFMILWQSSQKSEVVNLHALDAIADRDEKQDKSVVLLDLHQFMILWQSSQPEKSEVVYLHALDAIADRKDTMILVLNDLHARFIKGKRMKHLLVEGDAKLYDVLQSLKFEYGVEYSWLIPMLGDWHLLKNYQIALVKPYFEAGLKELAQVSGYPVAAIQTCGQFKRTHRFLLEAWESLYQVMIDKYFLFHENDECPDLYNEEILATARIAIQRASSSNQALDDLQSSLDRLTFKKEFLIFLNKMSETNLTWKFWSQFVVKDCLAYISLYTAIRNGNWDLRNASIKLMAPIFSA